MKKIAMVVCMLLLVSCMAFLPVSAAENKSVTAPLTLSGDMYVMSGWVGDAEAGWGEHSFYLDMWQGGFAPGDIPDHVVFTKLETGPVYDVVVQKMTAAQSHLFAAFTIEVYDSSNRLLTYVPQPADESAHQMRLTYKYPDAFIEDVDRPAGIYPIYYFLDQNGEGALRTNLYISGVVGEVYQTANNISVALFGRHDPTLGQTSSLSSNTSSTSGTSNVSTSSTAGSKNPKTSGMPALLPIVMATFSISLFSVVVWKGSARGRN